MKTIWKTLIGIFAVLLLVAGYAVYRLAPDYDVRQPVLEAVVDAEEPLSQHPEWRAYSYSLGGGLEWLMTSDE